MKKLAVVLSLIFAFALSAVGQELPNAPQPQPQPTVQNLPIILQPQPAVKIQKDHNFFLNKINTPVFFVQAGGAFWQAREVNGNASNFTTPSFWHRYLPNAYRESFAEMAAGDAIAYGFHKAHFKGHHWVERGIMWGTAAALYITADRNLKAYNKTDCVGGLTQFCN